MNLGRFPAYSVVVDDHPADVAAGEHVVVGLIDVVELVLTGDLVFSSED